VIWGKAGGNCARLKLLAAAGGAVVLAACAGQADGEGRRSANMAVPAVAGIDPQIAGRPLSRAIWGVVPEAPGHKRELRPALIAGSAVAVSPDTLLARCEAIGRPSRVGLGTMATVTTEETTMAVATTEAPL
jgi:hypothetical protein